MSILISKTTKKYLESYVDSPCASLIVSGRVGFGVNEIIDNIIAKLREYNKVTDIIIVGKPGESIGIDEVRSLKSSLKLKNITKNKVSKRIVVIKNAEDMTIEAQNSLLKLLEDSSQDNHFILGTISIEKLIETVLSRSNIIEVTRPTKKEVSDYYNISDTETNSLYVMCDGRPKFIEDILNGKDTEIKDTFEIAKNYVRSPVFERLVMTDDIAKNHNLKLFLFCLAQIFRALISSNSNKDISNAYTKKLKVISESQELIEKTNPNIKLLITRLSINI